MGECIKCKSVRLVDVSAKCSDLFSMTYLGKDYDGYVPHDMGIGGGDYIEFIYCLQCGQIQDNFMKWVPDDVQEEMTEDY